MKRNDTTADDEHENDEDEEENLDPDAGKSQQQIIDRTDEAAQFIP